MAAPPRIPAVLAGFNIPARARWWILMPPPWRRIQTIAIDGGNARRRFNGVGRAMLGRYYRQRSPRTELPCVSNSVSGNPSPLPPDGIRIENCCPISLSSVEARNSAMVGEELVVPRQIAYMDRQRTEQRAGTTILSGAEIRNGFTCIVRT